MTHGEVIPYFLNDTAYGSASYEPPYLFFGDVGALKFTIYSTADCDFGFEWAVDGNYELIATDTFQANAGVEISVVVPITARFCRVFVRNIASNPVNLKVQVFFLSEYSSGDVESVGSGISLVDNGDIKSLTSIDNSVTITDNVTEIDLSVAARAGMVTVGTVDADYSTIFDAVADMKCNIRVITDVVETQQVDLSAHCIHLRLELNPGIILSNTIAGAIPWFIGNNTLLSIDGAGSTIDFVSSGSSSEILLQSNQTLRDGANAELEVKQVRFTGSGTNDIVGGSSRFVNCRFNSATQFNLNTFENNLYVNGCLFTVPVQIDDNLGPLRSAVVIGNIFEDGANVLVNGTNSLIFSNNILGKSSSANLTIGGVLCDHATISNNVCRFSQIILNATTLNLSIVANNIVDSIVINSNITNCTIGSNNCNSLSVLGILDNLTMDSNIVANDLGFGVSITNSTISDNKCRDMSFAGIIGNNGNPVAISSNAIRRDLVITGRVRSSSITGNTVLRHCTFNERIGSGGGPVLFSNNVIDGDFLVVGNVIETSITGNNLGSSQLNGTLTRSVFSHNLVFLTGNINFMDDVFGSVINNNRCDNLLFNSSVGTTIGPVTLQNNAIRTDLVCNGIVSSVLFSTNYVGGNCTFTNLVGSITGRVNISSNSINVLNFNDILVNVIINGNSCQAVFILSSMTSCLINDNIIGDTTTTGTIQINGNISFTAIVSNQMRDMICAGLLLDHVSINSNSFDISNIGINALTINGQFQNGTISDNTMTRGFIISGTFLASVFASNRIALQTTAVTFNNSFINSFIVNNEVETFLFINGTASDGTVIGNKIRGLFLASSCATTLISTNILNRVTASPCLTIAGPISDTLIESNICQRGFQMGSPGVPTTMSGCRIKNNTIAVAGVQIYSNFLESVMNSNRVHSTIAIFNISTNSIFDANISTIGQLTLNTSNVGSNAGCIINANNIQSDIVLGSDGFAGSSENVITSNICRGSITTPNSNNINNIITSNRCSFIIGFGGSDVVNNNI